MAVICGPRRCLECRAGGAYTVSTYTRSSVRRNSTLKRFPPVLQPPPAHHSCLFSASKQGLCLGSSSPDYLFSSPPCRGAIDPRMSKLLQLWTKFCVVIVSECVSQIIHELSRLSTTNTLNMEKPSHCPLIQSVVHSLTQSIVHLVHTHSCEYSLLRNSVH